MVECMQSTARERYRVWSFLLKACTDIAVKARYTGFTYTQTGNVLLTRTVPQKLSAGLMKALKCKPSACFQALTELCLGSRDATSLCLM